MKPERGRPHLLGHHVPELDVLGAADAGRAVVLDQLVQGAELHHPEEELAAGVPQHLEVLHAVSTPVGGTVVSGETGETAEVTHSPQNKKHAQNGDDHRHRISRAPYKDLPSIGETAVVLNETLTSLNFSVIYTKKSFSERTI